MLSLIGQKAPHFNANAVFGNTFREISLEDYKGKYVVLFFYPLDFTFVCPTELHAFQENYAAFKALGAEVLACSIDSQFCHLAWLDTPKEQGGIQGIEYGLIADLGGKIAEQFGVLSTGGVAYRGLFLMDKEGIIRHMLVNDLPLGRSVPEAVRTLEALQHVETAGEVCPANWTKGSQAINTNKDSVGNYLGKRFA